MINPPFKSKDKFERFLVREYFRLGSVDSVFKEHEKPLPISYPQYQKILNKWGVVKNAGPNGKLSDVVSFFSQLAKDNLPFEKLYKELPSSYKTSAETLYRVLYYLKEGITRRIGVGVIITPEDNPEKVLIAKDVSMPRPYLGKFWGSLTFPVGYADKKSSRKINLLRILQQEVFTNMVIENKFPMEIVPQTPEPFAYVDIVDVRVALYHLPISRKLVDKMNFSSYKLKSYRFCGISDILERGNTSNFRLGVVESVNGYRKYLSLLKKNLKVNPIHVKSEVNTKLAELELNLYFSK